jgi:tetratricopeptide (TPR) repeat protein
LLALLALPWAAPAHGADDGGTRSVLATGAGNRALALGGAYAALADDASAALWNPGGLGRVTRIEAQFSQATLSELGFRETFAGFVLPDWRWGAVSATFRHFGAGEIDGRDDRNVPLGLDLGSRESELAAAYGRAIGEAWSVGAAGKLRRQEVAGRSGTGLGIDLGVQVRPGVALGRDDGWARELTAGLAVINAVQPAIRLDQESVPDPTTWRFGVALRQPALRWGGLLATLDVEHTHGINPRIHAGFELRPHPQLDLRAGLDDGGIRAGTALHLGQATVDYAFEDNPIGSGHRAGLTWRFGLPLDEQRAAFERAEEEKAQARFAEIYRSRQAERVAELVERARSERAAGRFDEAIEALHTLRALDSTHVEAGALEVECLREKGLALETHGDLSGAVVAFTRALGLAPGDSVARAGLLRSQAENDRRTVRGAEIRRLFAGALEALGADDLPRARGQLREILKLSPGDAEAQTLLVRVEATMRQRADVLARQGHRLLMLGLASEARALLEQARRLDPEAPGVLALAGALGSADSSAGRLRPGSSTRPAARLTAQQEREIADLYRRGIAAMEQGRSDDALRYWELVWSMRPGYQRVDQNLKREYQTRGMEAFAAGRLDEAVGLWSRALRVDPGDARTLGYLRRAQEQQARTREISGGGR